MAGEAYYNCSLCCKSIVKSTYPNSMGCRSNKNYGNHSWSKIGDAGKYPYECKYCGTTAYLSGSLINSSGCCSKENYGNHSWKQY